MKVINAKDYLELQLIINYNIQYTGWGLLQKVSSKMFVFVIVTVHISISIRRVQRTFVIANTTRNKFFATSKNFQSYHSWPWQFLQYTLVYWVPLFTNSTLYRPKKYKIRSFYQCWLLNSVSISEFERCLFRAFESQ